MDNDTGAVPAMIFFALTTHLSRDGRQAIVLHLYRGLAPAVTRTIATVEFTNVKALLAECRRHLETLGIEPMAHRINRDPVLLASELGKTG